MFTVNNKDTRLTSLILNIVNIGIHNTHYSCAKVTIFREVTLGGTNYITDKASQNKISLKASHLILQ